MLKLPSFAKINWTLQILGKRPDGYHEVVTVLQTVSLCDELTFELRDDDQICLTCDDPEIPVDDSNLIVKAAKALNGGGVDISLTKRIPAKAGLGGASSNAAVTVLALNNLWRKELSNTHLFNIASNLGADVPFFLLGGTAEGSGIGTDLCSVADVEQKQLIVIKPNASVSTATAYAHLKRGSLTTSYSAPILSSSCLHNDFEAAIFEIEPEIKRAKMALIDAGARGALLAGSGSSVFGIFDDEAARDRALVKLRSETGWRVFSCHTLTRAEYLQAMGPSGFPLLRS